MNRFADFDEQKSRATKADPNRKIDFVEARALWNQPVLEVLASFRGESRNKVIGKMGGKYWTAIVTYRRSMIRIISVRRAREKEIEQYERKFQTS